MRKIIMIVLFGISLNSFGQNTIVVYSDKSLIDLKEEVSLHSQFLDSLFYQGKVIFKNGNSSSALMNYNLLDNGIAFVDKENKVLILDGLEGILLVTYHKRVFIPNQGSFLEQIDTYKNDNSLLIKRVTSVSKNTVSGPYGMNTQTSNINRVSSLNGTGSSVQFYNDLTKEIRVDVTLDTEYFLKLNGKLKPVSRIKDLKKLFPAKKDSIMDFISSNNLNINNQNDLKRLVKYCMEDVR